MLVFLDKRIVTQNFLLKLNDQLATRAYCFFDLPPETSRSPPRQLHHETCCNRVSLMLYAVIRA